MKYRLTIEGDFRWGECEKCPICINPNEYVGCRLPFKECLLEEVKQGEWKKIEVDMCYFYICSNCGCDIPENRFHDDWFSNFCPNCGTPMKGGK